MNHRIVLLTALLLPGCGGSGSPGGGGPTPVTVTILSAFARDGYGANNGFVDLSHGIAVGDFEATDPGLYGYGYVGFDLVAAGIPPGATVQSATLAVEQASVGVDPYTTLGNLLVDHVDLGASIDFADFSAVPLESAFGVLSTDAVIEVKTVGVGPQVQADLAAGRTFSDFRLRFGGLVDLDGGYDLVTIGDSEEFYPLRAKPTLKVRYVP